MAGLPEACPSCGTAIPAGRTRCPGCGKVFGEDNRCPSCHAVTGIVPTTGGAYACAACSAPRQKLPGTVVLGGGGLLPPRPRAAASAATAGAPGQPSNEAASVPRVQPTAAARRGASAGLRLLGAGSIAVGVLAATALGILVPGAAGLILAAVMGGGFVGVGALSLRAGAKAGARADETNNTARELGILNLAEGSDGDLTTTEVARGLGISLSDADAALSTMAAAGHVSVEVDAEGIVHYIFRELRQKNPAGPRLRVDASMASREAVAEEQEALAELEAELAAEAESAEH